MSRYIGSTKKMIEECLTQMVHSNKDLNILFPVITLQRGNRLKQEILNYLNTLELKWSINNNTIEIFIGDNIHKICINVVNQYNLRGQYFDMVNININEIERFDYTIISMVKNPSRSNIVHYINVYEG